MAGYREMRDRTITAYRGRTITLTFQLDRAGWRKIAMSDGLRSATTSVVRDRALPYAKQISPYDPTNKSKPHYRDSFVIRQSTTTINDLRRVSSRLFNVSDHATEVEFLNRGRRGGPLSRTVSFLIHESVLAELLRGVENKAKFTPEQHPRGARGRFIKRSTAVPDRRSGSPGPT